MSNTNAVSLTCISAEELQLHLSGYDSVELLATGGMGAVFKARQITLDRPVAIKILTHACASSLQFRQIFKCEAQVMAKLSHPNLASIYDYGEVNGMLYIVMQFIEGRNLHDAANGRAVQQSEAGGLIAKISRALHHAHKAGVLHRDIKPANVLITKDVDPVVVDFGLAHQAEESTMVGNTVFGTPGYTAPEVLAPPYKADQRADVFSLGVLLHELLTGQLPQSPYMPPSSFGRVDPRYDAVCARALHPCVAMRYSSAEKLADDLDLILAGKQLCSSSLMTVRTNFLTASSAAAPIAQPPSIQTPNRSAMAVAHHRPIPTTLPSLNTQAQKADQTKAAMVALAACITFVIAVIALIYTSQQPSQSSPMATGSSIIESTPVTK